MEKVQNYTKHLATNHLFASMSHETSLIDYSFCVSTRNALCTLLLSTDQRTKERYFRTTQDYTCRQEFRYYNLCPHACMCSLCIYNLISFILILCSEIICHMHFSRKSARMASSPPCLRFRICALPF
jgi:hypothetical protein